MSWITLDQKVRLWTSFTLHSKNNGAFSACTRWVWKSMPRCGNGNDLMEMWAADRHASWRIDRHCSVWDKLEPYLTMIFRERFHVFNCSVESFQRQYFRNTTWESRVHVCLQISTTRKLTLENCWTEYTLWAITKRTIQIRQKYDVPDPDTKRDVWRLVRFKSIIGHDLYAHLESMICWWANCTALQIFQLVPAVPSLTLNEYLLSYPLADSNCRPLQFFTCHHIVHLVRSLVG